MASADRRGTVLLVALIKGERREDFEPATLPIWREAFAGVDWLRLRASPVYRGVGVPAGDGSAVVVVPGFLGSDTYLRGLQGWLGRVGYRGYLSGIGRNAECPDVLVERLRKTVDLAHRETGQSVHLVGHSLGGVLSRAVAVLERERIASVATMGSPIRGVRAHPFVLQAASLVRRRIAGRERGEQAHTGCYSGGCRCEAVEALRQEFPASVPQMAIYTKNDGVVDWRYCVNDDPATDVEVAGTHVGLVFNPQVYQHLAHHLAGTRAGAERPAGVGLSS